MQKYKKSTLHVRNKLIDILQALLIFFSTSNQEEWDGQGTWHVWGVRRVSYRVLVGKLEGKRPLGRPKCRWGDNIKISVQETGHEDVNWIHPVQDSEMWRAVVKAAMNLRVP
jgi:hypothetical protein